MYFQRALVATCSLFAVATTAGASSPLRATPRAALVVPRGGAAAPAPKKAGGGAKSKAAVTPSPFKGLLACCSLDKAGVVKLHGTVGLVIASCWALETFGVPSVPAIGLQGTIKGINMDDPVTKFLVRVGCTFGAGLFLAEIDPSTNPHIQKIYTLYHIPLVLTALAGAREFATGSFGYALTSVAALFLVLGIVA